MNVRQGPGTQFDTLGQLQSGDIVPVLGRSDAENNWLLVPFGGTEGWVAFFTVTVTGDLSTLEIINRQLVSAPDTTAGASALEAPSLPFVSTNDLTGKPFITAFRRINVRLGPGSEFGRLGFLNPGNIADITGRTEDNEWIQIDFEGQIGWVAFFVVSVSGDFASVPVVFVDRNVPTPAPTATRTPAPLDVRVATSFNTNLRAAPEFEAATLGTIPFNTELRAEARTQSGAWLRVTYNGQTGWVLTSLMTPVFTGFNNRVERLPVVGQ
ncbi:MAG: SH3 domain-containing protein [bacterium]|nr:SH3 domain-containing protein [bacterium]